jgi:hypothetical protein
MREAPSIIPGLPTGAATALSSASGMGVGMRWIIVAGLAGMFLGLCLGVALGLSVGRSAVAAANAAPFAPEMSVARFIQCSAVEPEPDYEALFAPWRARQIRNELMDWPAP